MSRGDIINLEPLESFLGMCLNEQNRKIILDHSDIEDNYKTLKNNFWHIRYCILLLKSSNHNVLSEDPKVQESIKEWFLSKATHLLQGCLYYADFCENAIKICGDGADEKKQGTLTAEEKEQIIPFEERGDESLEEIVEILKNYNKTLVALKNFLAKVLPKPSGAPKPPEAKSESLPNLVAYLWKLKPVYGEIKIWQNEIKEILDIQDLEQAMRRMESEPRILLPKFEEIVASSSKGYALVLMSVSNEQKLEVEKIIKFLEKNKTLKRKPILIKQGDKFILYGFSEKDGWKLIHELDANQFRCLVFNDKAITFEIPQEVKDKQISVVQSDKLPKEVHGEITKGHTHITSQQALQKISDAVSSRQNFILKFLQIIAQINVAAKKDTMPSALPEGKSLIVGPKSKYPVIEQLNSLPYRKLKSKFIHHILYIRGILFGLKIPIAVERIYYGNAVGKGFIEFAQFLNKDKLEKFEKEVSTYLRLMYIQKDSYLLPTIDMELKDIYRSTLLAERAEINHDTFTKLCVNINLYILLVIKRVDIIENLKNLKQDLNELIKLCQQGQDKNIQGNPFLQKNKGELYIKDKDLTHERKLADEKELVVTKMMEASRGGHTQLSENLKNIVKCLSEAVAAISNVLEKHLSDESSTLSKSSSSSSMSTTSSSSPSVKPSTSSSSSIVSDNSSSMFSTISSSNSSSTSSIDIFSNSTMEGTLGGEGKDWSSYKRKEIQEKEKKNENEDEGETESILAALIPLSLTTGGRPGDKQIKQNNDKLSSRVKIIAKNG